MTYKNYELAEKIRTAQSYDEVIDECAELCENACLVDDWSDADGDTFIDVLRHAQEILGVDCGV